MSSALLVLHFRIDLDARSTLVVGQVLHFLESVYTRLTDLPGSLALMIGKRMSMWFLCKLAVGIHPPCLWRMDRYWLLEARMGPTAQLFHHLNFCHELDHVCSWIG